MLILGSTTSRQCTEGLKGGGSGDLASMEGRDDLVGSGGRAKMPGVTIYRRRLPGGQTLQSQEIAPCSSLDGSLTYPWSHQTPQEMEACNSRSYRQYHRQYHEQYTSSDMFLCLPRKKTLPRAAGCFLGQVWLSTHYFAYWVRRG